MRNLGIVDLGMITLGPSASQGPARSCLAVAGGLGERAGTLGTITIS